MRLIRLLAAVTCIAGSMLLTDPAEARAENSGGCGLCLQWCPGQSEGNNYCQTFGCGSGMQACLYDPGCNGQAPGEYYIVCKWPD